MPRAGSLTARRNDRSSRGLSMQPQVGEDVLVFLAVVKRQAADDLVRERWLTKADSSPRVKALMRRKMAKSR